MSEQNEPEILESIIASNDLSTLTQEYGEIAIDGFLDDGVLKDIPLLGTAVKVASFGNSISKKLFLKKIYKFLFQLQNIPSEKRTKFISKVNDSRRFQSKIGETVFEILDRIESDGKPEIVGKLFVAVINQNLDYRDFLRLSHIVKNQFYFDLVDLKNHTEGDFIKGLEINNSLSMSGLTSTDFAGYYRDAVSENEKPETYTSLTKYGKLLVGYGFS